MTSVLSLLCFLILAQSQPPKPQGTIPPSVDRRLALVMPKLTAPQRLEQYRAAKQMAGELRDSLLAPLQKGIVRPTPYERVLIYDMADAAIPEAFLFGPEWKFLQAAAHRMRVGVSLSVQRTLDAYRRSKPPNPVLVEVFRSGKPVKKR